MERVKKEFAEGELEDVVGDERNGVVQERRKTLSFTSCIAL